MTHSPAFTAEAEKASQWRVAWRVAVKGERNLPPPPFLLKARSEVRVASGETVTLSLCSRGLSPCDG